MARVDDGLQANWIRVPFFAAYPGVFPAGLEYSQPVSTLDIFPTVAALTGVTPPNKLDGINLAPFLMGETKEPPHDALYFHTTNHGVILKGRWKLVVAPDGRSEWFDLAVDQGERRNLASVEPELAKQLAQEWRSWKAGMWILQDGL